MTEEDASPRRRPSRHLGSSESASIASQGIDAYVGSGYLSHNPGWHEDHGQWKATQVWEILLRNGIEPRSVLDIGCGTGAVLDHLSRLVGPGCRLIGYDVSEMAVSLAPKIRRRRVELMAGDVFETDDRADVTLLIDVLEHVPDYIGFLLRLRQRTDWIVLHVPLELSVQTVARIQPILRARAAVGHIHYFTAETLSAAVSDAGYDIVDLSYTRGSIELPNRSVRTRAAAWPRRVMFSMSPPIAARLLGGFSALVLARSKMRVSPETGVNDEGNT